VRLYRIAMRLYRIAMRLYAIAMRLYAIAMRPKLQNILEHEFDIKYSCKSVRYKNIMYSLKIFLKCLIIGF